MTPRSGRKLPPWLAKAFTQRDSGLGKTGPRNATDGINAMLNLACTKEAGRLSARLAASGACLGIGYLHVDKVNRHSLVWDAIEPLRPLIEARVYKFVKEHRFERGDFLRLSDGHVRLVPELIKVFLQETLLPESDIEQASQQQ